MSLRKGLCKQRKNFSSGPVLIITNCKLMERINEISRRAFCSSTLQQSDLPRLRLRLQQGAASECRHQGALRHQCCRTMLRPLAVCFMSKWLDQAGFISSLVFSNIVNSTHSAASHQLSISLNCHLLFPDRESCYLAASVYTSYQKLPRGLFFLKKKKIG